MSLGKKTTRFMSSEQKALVSKQWEKHQHDDFVVDYDVSGEKDLLEGFVINKGVWNPLIASGRYHARYFFYHSNLFQGKTVAEIGCGSGLIGIVMAKYGAQYVTMSDISEKAVQNTKQNIKKFNLGAVASVLKGDLFENITKKVDLIVWMIPFFSGYPEGGDHISASMIMPPELFERFLVKAKNYLNPGGVIVLPSFELGGELTDPVLVAPRFGYEVRTTWSHRSINNIQQGMLYMHELRLR
jgi:release factor glutamine methyltransferase